MWIVVRDWGIEVAVDEFENEDEANDFYNEWIDKSDVIYLAKVLKNG